MSVGKFAFALGMVQGALNGEVEQYLLQHGVPVQEIIRFKDVAKTLSLSFYKGEE